MLDTILNYLLELGEHETFAPILEFLFKWLWLGPMYVVDHVVFPIVNTIGEFGFVFLSMFIVMCLFIRFVLRPDTAKPEYIPEVIYPDHDIEYNLEVKPRSRPSRRETS